MAPGKCPGCGQYVTFLQAHALTAKVGEHSWKALAYHCPNPMCQAVLGCQLDPIAIKTDILNELVALLRK